MLNIVYYAGQIFKQDVGLRPVGRFGDSDKSLPAQGLADARIGCRPTHDTPHYMQEVRLTVQRMRMELNGSTPGF